MPGYAPRALTLAPRQSPKANRRPEIPAGIPVVGRGLGGLPVREDEFPVSWRPPNGQVGARWPRMQRWLQRQAARAVVGDTLTTPTGTYPGIYAYFGGVLLPDGRVFCVPYNATSARIYDPVTNTLTTPPGTYPGSSAYAGGVLLPDGRVFCDPRNATSARIYGGISNLAPLDLNFVTSPYFNKF